MEEHTPSDIPTALTLLINCVRFALRDLRTWLSSFFS